MKFRIEVKLPECPFHLTTQSRVAFFGSCFATYIGEKMAQCLPTGYVSVNPYGALYNPVSIGMWLDYLSDTEFRIPDELAFLSSDGMWHHWFASTLVQSDTKELLMQQMKRIWEQTRNVLVNANVLFVTFSTDKIYCLSKEPNNGVVVVNCHKQPATMFTEKNANYKIVQERWTQLVHKLSNLFPHLHIVFTLSPYRYLKEGLHENALIKARLLLLIDNLCKNCLNVSYFPAYEIVTDELRDYRFYNSDMLHPSEQAIEYVWEKFKEWTFTQELTNYSHERLSLLRDKNHIPLNPKSEATQLFLKQREERINAFKKKWGVF